MNVTTQIQCKEEGRQTPPTLSVKNHPEFQDEVILHVDRWPTEGKITVNADELQRAIQNATNQPKHT